VVRPAAGGQAVYEDSRRDHPAPTEVAVNRAADRAAWTPPGRTGHPLSVNPADTRIILAGIARYCLRADATANIWKAGTSLLMARRRRPLSNFRALNSGGNGVAAAHSRPRGPLAAVPDGLASALCSRPSRLPIGPGRNPTERSSHH
jgi:hypothetical protein